MTPDVPLISVSGLERHFAGTEGCVLRFRPFDLPRAKITAIVGPSGVGKTTLLNILAGIDPATKSSGNARALFWPELDKAPYDLLEWARYPRHLVSTIFQRGYLLSNISIGMNIAAPMALAGREPSDEYLRQLLLDVGFDSATSEVLIDSRPFQVSGGQAQRVGIARAIARDPALLFADEPTSNLDEDARDNVMSMLAHWLDREATRSLILVSHDLDLVARHADVVMLVHEASPASAGPADVSVTQVPEGLAGPEQLRDLIEAAAKGKAMEVLAAKAGVGSRAAAVDVSARSAAVRNRTASGSGDAHRPGKVLRKLVLSELLSRRGGSQPDARFATAVARWDRNVSFATLLRFVRHLGETSSIAVALLSVVVTLAMALAFAGNFERLGKIVSDPRNCSLLVSATRDSGSLKFDDDTLDMLSSRRWRAAGAGTALSAGAATPPRADSAGQNRSLPEVSCDSGPAVFERYDTSQIFLGLPREDGACPDRSVNVALLATKRNDPILSTSRVTTPGAIPGLEAGSTLADVFRDPLFQSRDLVFLSRDFVLRLKENGTLREDADGASPSLARICLQRGRSRPAVYEVGGVVDDLPAPQRRAYEAMMPQNAYLNLAYGARGPSAPPPQAVVYFDQGGVWSNGQVGHLENFLSGKFGFEQNDLDKSERLRAEARASVLALGLLCAFNFALFGFITYSSTLKYLRANAPQIGVLRTFGFGFGHAVRHGFLLTGYNIGLAAIPLVVALGLVRVWTPIAFGEGVEIGWGEVVAGLAAILAVFSILSFLSVYHATRRWWGSTKLLSEIIG